MSVDLEYAEVLAAATISAMGVTSRDWVVAGVEFYDLDARAITSKWSEAVEIALHSRTGRFDATRVYLTRGALSLADSAAYTVGEIQDAAVESTVGEPLPPCPGHVHPLVPRVIDGVPKWVCMTEGPAHHSQDVLPGFDPAFETPEEYLLLSGR